MNKAIMGIVESHAKAEALFLALRRAGFYADEISVLFSNELTNTDHGLADKVPEGAIAGASAGSVVGGTLGLLAGFTSLAIPGVGLLVAAGPILAALSGAAAGATVGGMTGALVGLGISEVEADILRGRVRGGAVLIAVQARDAKAQSTATEIFERADAKEVAPVATVSA